MEYAARVTKEAPHTLVVFSDCPGWQTFGKTRVEALAMAAEAICSPAAVKATDLMTDVPASMPMITPSLMRVRRHGQGRLRYRD